MQERKMEVVKETPESPKEKIDSMYILERTIIQILLLYGDNVETFEEQTFEVEDEKIDAKKTKVERKVYEKVFLSLQEDEIEMSNSLFQNIFQDIMKHCTSNNNWNLENYLITMSPSLTHEITSIIMDEEKHVLHNWESQNIIAKTKDMGIEQLVNETILTYRNLLVFHIIKNFS